MKRYIAAAVVLIVGATVAGCGSGSGGAGGGGSSSSSSGGSSGGSSGSGVNTSDATSFWRQQVAHHYGGPVATDDGRGCAQASSIQWVCTAHVNNPSRDIDVYGTVTTQGGPNGTMTVNAHLNRGSEITAWFTRTGGGCQTASCDGTRFR